MHAGMHPSTPTLVESPLPLTPSRSNPDTTNLTSDLCEWKGIVLSLIRHAESTANVSSISNAGINSPLSSNGITQAKKLAEEWSSTRVDHLLSSFLNRAVDTAQAIADAQNARHAANKYKSQKSQSNLTNGIKHEHHGPEECSESDPEPESDLDDSDSFISVIPITLLREALIKKDTGESKNTSKEGERRRDDVEAEPRIQSDPLGLPETPEQVSARAYIFLSATIDTFGIITPSSSGKTRQDGLAPHNKDTDSSSSIPSLHPDQVDPNKWKGPPEVLPPGLPHVAAVGHNIFFCELYERMARWNDEEHETSAETKTRKGREQSNICWDNADWSRHLVWIRRPQPDSTGWELRFENLRLPGCRGGSGVGDNTH